MATTRRSCLLLSSFEQKRARAVLRLCAKDRKECFLRSTGLVWALLIMRTSCGRAEYSARLNHSDGRSDAMLWGAKWRSDDQMTANHTTTFAEERSKLALEACKCHLRLHPDRFKRLSMTPRTTLMHLQKGRQQGRSKNQDRATAMGEI
jgi:hypothetical protein